MEGMGKSDVNGKRMLFQILCAGQLNDLLVNTVETRGCFRKYWYIEVFSMDVSDV